jgi:ABC-type proline/glycine betaine transport system permease subunit
MSEPRSPLRGNNENHLANLIAGTLIGGLIGGGMGLGACMFIFEGTLLFPGDTVLAGALICGLLGLVFGEGFIEWLKENWWWLW